MSTPYRFAPDTTAEASALLVRCWRSMTAADKAAHVVALNEASRRGAMSGLRQRHPGATPDEIEQHWRRLRLGDELYERVYAAVDIDD